MVTEHATMRLKNGSRIAVVGGGPAGSFFSLRILQLADKKNLNLEVTVYERKDLASPGPVGCNMCAGVISSRLLRALPHIGLNLPPEVVLAHIGSYVVHWRGDSVEIQPPDPNREIVTIYRGGGPRKGSVGEPPSSFDAFLLDQAAAHGARVRKERVVEVSFESAKPQVSTLEGVESFDLVTLAAGVNTTPIILRGVDYSPPQTEVMAQDEILLDLSREHMNGSVHVYFDQPLGLVFGGLVPKGTYTNVSLLGRDLGQDSIGEFLRSHKVTSIVGEQPQRLCGCRPRIAVQPAHGYYADRFVAIGDASATRLYKDGIGSALATACAAAETAVLHGLRYSDFARHYAPNCYAISRDNQYGRRVFNLVEAIKGNDYLLRTLGRVLTEETTKELPSRILSGVLWGMFTGDTTYREIFRQILSPRCMLRFGSALLQELRQKKGWMAPTR